MSKLKKDKNKLREKFKWNIFDDFQPLCTTMYMYKMLKIISMESQMS